MYYTSSTWRNRLCSSRKVAKCLLLCIDVGLIGPQMSVWTCAQSGSWRSRGLKGVETCLPNAHPVHVICGGGSLSVTGRPLTRFLVARRWMR